jgi:hypothetical protein
MMRSVFIRLAAVVAGVVIVASCDSRMPSQAVVSSSSSSSTTGKPTVAVDSPLVNALINVKDSIYVVMTLHDDKALKSASVVGYTYKGSEELGTLKTTARFTLINVPVSGTFRDGLRDTTIRRYLKAASADTTLDSVVVVAIVSDKDGNADTTRRRVDLVAGPKVTITTPLPSDSVPAGVGLGITSNAVHPDGIAQMSIRVTGELTWPTRLDTTVSVAISGAPRTSTQSTVVRVPANAPVRGRLTVTAKAIDVVGQPGSSNPIIIYVRSPNNAQPRVTQTVLARAEYGDSIKVSASGDGIAAVGYVARDSAGRVIRRDSVLLSQPYPANAVQSLAMEGIPTVFQGKRIAITAFAVDQQRRTGYAVRPTQAGAEGNLLNALVDSSLIVYGRTYKLPRAGGSIGDIAVDRARGNVLLSNTAYNRLEVWQNGTRRFDDLGVAVGSQPWGLFISNNPDTLLVANSGGTNISRVFIGSTNARSIREDSLHRILTRGTYVFVVNETRDEKTSKVTISTGAPIIFSDRPQYIGQIATGDIFYSTKPTPAAQQGTIRYIDPKQAYPDPKPVLLYRAAPTDLTNYIVVNADSVFVRRALASTAQPDTLVIYDHPPGTLLKSDSAVSTVGVGAAVAALRTINGSDVSFVQGADVSALGLTDTTFVAVSGDRKWISFGEGNTGNARIVMASQGFFSPVISQLDLTANTAERVNGLALDQSGVTMAAHGIESYFTAVDLPFHLRLQGKYTSNASGAGIVFHPQANGVTSPDQSRTAFISSGNRTVEVVDIFHYINRGRLELKNSLYGPLRATLPLPGDAPDVILKLFGLTAEGLVVIDLRDGDILPIP